MQLFVAYSVPGHGWPQDLKNVHRSDFRAGRRNGIDLTEMPESRKAFGEKPVVARHLILGLTRGRSYDRRQLWPKISSQSHENARTFLMPDGMPNFRQLEDLLPLPYSQIPF
jgi:hypothetical protein